MSAREKLPLVLRSIEGGELTIYESRTSEDVQVVAGRDGVRVALEFDLKELLDVLRWLSEEGPRDSAAVDLEDDRNAGADQHVAPPLVSPRDGNEPALLEPFAHLVDVIGGDRELLAGVGQQVASRHDSPSVETRDVFQHAAQVEDTVGAPPDTAAGLSAAAVSGNEVVPSDQLVGSGEAARILRRPRRTVQRWAREGKLPVAVQMPGATGAVLVRREDVKALAKEPPA